MKLTDIIVPLPVFYQPERFFADMKDLGYNILVGPNVENESNLAKNNPAELLRLQQQWIDKGAAAGFGLVVKTPWLFKLNANVVGFTYSIDEPNIKIVPGTTRTYSGLDLKPEFDKLRALDPSKPVLVTLAGGQVTSQVKVGNRDYDAQVSYYKGFADVSDIWAFDVYSINRDATRYKTSWSADVTVILRALAPDQPVWVWGEVNDQKLKDSVNGRAPTPAEIVETYTLAEKAGATGFGGFLTSDTGAYGWPGSFYPQVDRNGVSMKPQYDAVRSFNRLRASTFTPPVVTPPVVVDPAPTPAPTPSLEDRVALLEAEVRALSNWKAQPLGK